MYFAASGEPKEISPVLGPSDSRLRLMAKRFDFKLLEATRDWMKLGYCPVACERPRIPSIGKLLKSSDVMLAIPSVTGRVMPAKLKLSFPKLPLQDPEPYFTDQVLPSTALNEVELGAPKELWFVQGSEVQVGPITQVWAAPVSSSMYSGVLADPN